MVDGVEFGNVWKALPSLPRMKLKLALAASAASENVMFATADQSASPEMNPFCSAMVQLDAASNQ